MRKESKADINLAPADLRKEGPAYDLPISVGVLLASEQIFGNLDGAIMMCELSLEACATCRACCRWSSWPVTKDTGRCAYPPKTPPRRA